MEELDPAWPGFAWPGLLCLFPPAESGASREILETRIGFDYIELITDRLERQISDRVIRGTVVPVVFVDRGIFSASLSRLSSLKTQVFLRGIWLKRG